MRGKFEILGIRHEATFEASRCQEVFRHGRENTAADPASNLCRPVSPVMPAAKPKRSEIALTGFTLADTMSMLNGGLLLTIGVRHQRIASDNFDKQTGVVTSSHDDSVVT